MIRTFFHKYKLALLGLITGGVGGYLYWQFVGCLTGSCPITSSPVNSTIFGAILGVLIFTAFKDEEKK